MNNYVEVDVRQATHKVVCKFLNHKSTSEKKCNILYGPVGGNCRSLSQASKSLSDTVTIGLPLDEDREIDYCFSVIANNGTVTVIVEGTFNVGKQ